MKLLIRVTTVLLFLATTCNSTAHPQEANPDVVLTGQADGVPVGCSPEDITGHISEMLDAIGRSNPNVVDEYFGRKMRPLSSDTQSGNLWPILGRNSIFTFSKVTSSMNSFNSEVSSSMAGNRSAAESRR